MNAVQKVMAKFDMMRLGIDPIFRHRVLEIAQYGSFKNGTKIKNFNPNLYTGDLGSISDYLAWQKKASLVKSTSDQALRFMRMPDAMECTQRFFAKHAYAGFAIRAQVKEHVRVINKESKKHTKGQEAVLETHKQALKAILEKERPWLIYSKEFKALKNKEFLS